MRLLDIPLDDRPVTRSLESALSILEVVRRLRAVYPEMPLYGFNILQRISDDWAYQTVVRSSAGIRELEQTFGVTYGDLADEAVTVSRAVGEKLLALYRDQLAPLVREHDVQAVEIGPVSFPWNRLFEIELPVRVRPVVE